MLTYSSASRPTAATPRIPTYAAAKFLTELTRLFMPLSPALTLLFNCFWLFAERLIASSICFNELSAFTISALAAFRARVSKLCAELLCMRSKDDIIIFVARIMLLRAGVIASYTCIVVFMVPAVPTLLFPPFGFLKFLALVFRLYIYGGHYKRLFPAA